MAPVPLNLTPEPGVATSTTVVVVVVAWLCLFSFTAHIHELDTEFSSHTSLEIGKFCVAYRSGAITQLGTQIDDAAGQMILFTWSGSIVVSENIDTENRDAEITG